MNEKEKNKRYFKRLLPLFILFVVCFGALGWSFMAKGTKVKAGVIVGSTYQLNSEIYTLNGGVYNVLQLKDLSCIGLKYASLRSSGGSLILTIYTNQSQNTSLTAPAYYNFKLQYYDGSTANMMRFSLSMTKTSGAPSDAPAALSTQFYAADTFNYNNEIYLIIDFDYLNKLEDYKTYNGELSCVINSNDGTFFKKTNTIKSIENNFNLDYNTITLLYLNDISGLNTNDYADEITINWGYINDNDTSVYNEYSPTITTKNNINNISVGIPINAAGDAMNYYTIDQSAILTTISTGGATATAHIYGLYFWLQQNRIQWGIVEFDTSGLPASGASMNYITSSTAIYDYTNADTSTMTCRLSISNNYNFITIKNQYLVDVNDINDVIRQGGFLPAWAVYNWARGSAAGYTSGEQAGAAPYQPGNSGYNEIYQSGYRDGVNANIGTQNWFVSAFSAVDALLSIRLLPNITIGTIVGIPFVISLVWFIIRTFRGGGSG